MKSSELKKQNMKLVKRKVKFIEDVLKDGKVTENQCFCALGTKLEVFRTYFAQLLEQKGLTVSGMHHDWELGFHLNPYKLTLSNPLQRGTAFYYENIYPIPKKNNQSLEISMSST